MNAACLPPFSWSHTRDRIFSTCARRYYLRYYAGAGGWRTDADPACRQAYALRHLTTFELALGLEIHQRAREIAAAVREHRAPSTLAALRERTRAAMNQLYRRRDVEAFLADPKRFPLRMEVFYGRGTDPERLERVRAKMELCLEALHGCCLWGDLAELGRRDILMVDRLSTLTVDDIPVYAAPDLVYRSDTGHIIVEWKTGRDPLVREQTALYGLFVRDGLGVPCAEGRLHVRLFRLDLATEETWEITAPDLEAAEARVQHSVAAMRCLLQGPEANMPEPKSAFPLTSSRGQCPRCPFWALCEGEIRNSGPAAFKRNTSSLATGHWELNS